MATPISTRMWMAYEAANRPWPVLDPDPVIDFQIMEAVAAKVAQEKEKQHKEAERKNWKKKVSEDDELMQYAG